MKTTSNCKTLVFIAIDASKYELAWPTYWNRQVVFNSTLKDDFCKKKKMTFVSSTNIDIIHTIEWYIEEYFCHKKILTSFYIILLHSEKLVIDIDTKVWYISGRLMAWICQDYLSAALR